MEVRTLPFLAIGRIQDQVILATFCDMSDGQAETEQIFKRLLLASGKKLAPGQRQRLQWKEWSVCCFLDPRGDILYCVMTSSMAYPEKYSFQLLGELRDQVHHGTDLLTAPSESLNSTVQPLMEELASQYEDTTKLDRVNMLVTKTEEVKAVMQNTVTEVMNTGDELRALEKKSLNLSIAADSYRRTAKKVRRNYWWRNKKMVLAGSAVALLVMLVVTIESLSDNRSPNLRPQRLAPTLRPITSVPHEKQERVVSI